MRGSLAAPAARLTATLAATAVAALFAGAVAREPPVSHSSGLAVKKGDDAGDASREATGTSALLATLVQTHTDERVPLDDTSPTFARFDALLSDRATGSSTKLDPRLLGLLRTMASKYGAPAREGRAPAIELVSGFRSPKLNEMMRKKGHHVASHSQHSLGHAVDFRIVLPCGDRADRADGGDAGAECLGASEVALDPRTVARAIRETGWDGGVGIYTSKDDWFVHADVGPERSWYEGPRGPETEGMGRR